MKHLLLTTIAAVLLVGCGESQPPEPSTAKAPYMSIHFAAWSGNIKVVKQHLAAGTDVDAKDKYRRTPLLRAAWGGHKEIVELLIAEGADVNAKDVFFGMTSLHRAAMEGHKEIAELLIDNSADVNATTNRGTTPLDEAIFGNHSEIADLLRKHGGKTKKELKAAGN